MEIKEFTKGIAATATLSACLLTLLVLFTQINQEEMTVPQMAAEIRNRGFGVPMNPGSILSLAEWVEPNILGENRMVRIIYNDEARTFIDHIDIPDLNAEGAREQIEAFAQYGTGVYDIFWQVDCADGSGDYDVRAAIWNERGETGFYAGRAVSQEDEGLIYIEDYPGFISNYTYERQVPDGFLVSTGHGDTARISEADFNRELGICLPSLPTSPEP